MENIINELWHLNTDLIQVNRELSAVNASFQKKLMKDYNWRQFFADNASKHWNSDEPTFDIEDLNEIKDEAVSLTFRCNISIELRDIWEYRDYGGDGIYGVYYTKCFNSYKELMEEIEKYKIERYHYYTGNITPENDIVFVFGSNPEGRHGAGSAKHAMQKFGAKYGKGYGYVGNSYAIATTDLRLPNRPNIKPYEIIRQIKEMYKFAIEHPELKFKIAYRNQLNDKTLCGYTGHQLEDMFVNKSGEIPHNVYFSKEWYDNIEYVKEHPIG